MNQPGAGTRYRWHTHGWNTRLSWELILGITPRLPGFVLAPLRHVVALTCFACMPRERAAARRNLERVTGRTGLASLRLVYRLFHNFSRFMVAYGEMPTIDRAGGGRLSGAEGADRTIRAALAEGRGAIIVTAHVGHWDLGLRLLSRFGVPIHVVMLSEEPAEVARFADRARSLPLLRVHQMGSSTLLAVELMAALKRGEIVAIQADRPVGGNVLATPFFGSVTDLPTGPAQLAMATGAPLVPVFVLLDRGDRFRLLALDPMRLDRGRADDAGAALAAAMRRVAATIESVVSEYPDQWFNFYDVWPRAARADR